MWLIAYLFSLIHGVGEVDIQEKDEKDGRHTSNEEEQSLVPDVESLPYLLLDVRDEDAYRQCHVIGGEYMYFSASITWTERLMAEAHLLSHLPYQRFHKGFYQESNWLFTDRKTF